MTSLMKMKRQVIVEAVRKCCDYGLMSRNEFDKFLNESIQELSVRDLSSTKEMGSYSEEEKRSHLYDIAHSTMNTEIEEGLRRVPDPFPFYGARISIKQPRGVRDGDVIAWIDENGDEKAYRLHYLFGSQAIAAQGPNLQLWVQMENAFIAGALTPHLRIAIAQQRRKDVGTGKEKAHR